MSNGKRHGFTLMELLVVVVIIGILAGIAVAIFLNQRVAAWKASTASDVTNTVRQVELASADNNGSLDGLLTSTKCYDNTNGDYSENGTDSLIGKQNVPVSNGNKVCITITTDGTGYTIQGTNRNVTGWVYVYTSNNGTGEWEKGDIDACVGQPVYDGNLTIKHDSNTGLTVNGSSSDLKDISYLDGMISIPYCRINGNLEVDATNDGVKAASLIKVGGDLILNSNNTWFYNDLIINGILFSNGITINDDNHNVVVNGSSSDNMTSIMSANSSSMPSLNDDDWISSSSLSSDLSIIKNDVSDSDDVSVYLGVTNLIASSLSTNSGSIVLGDANNCPSGVGTTVNMSSAENVIIGFTCHGIGTKSTPISIKADGDIIKTRTGNSSDYIRITSIANILYWKCGAQGGNCTISSNNKLNDVLLFTNGSQEITLDGISTIKNLAMNAKVSSDSVKSITNNMYIKGGYDYSVNMPGITDIGGDLYIGDNGIAGLSSLHTIGGNLSMLPYSRLTASSGLVVNGAKSISSYSTLDIG